MVAFNMFLGSFILKIMGQYEIPCDKASPSFSLSDLRRSPTLDTLITCKDTNQILARIKFGRRCLTVTLKTTSSPKVANLCHDIYETYTYFLESYYTLKSAPHHFCSISPDLSQQSNLSRPNQVDAKDHLTPNQPIETMSSLPDELCIYWRTRLMSSSIDQFNLFKDAVKALFDQKQPKKKTASLVDLTLPQTMHPKPRAQSVHSLSPLGPLFYLGSPSPILVTPSHSIETNGNT